MLEELYFNDRAYSLNEDEAPQELQTLKLVEEPKKEEPKKDEHVDDAATLLKNNLAKIEDKAKAEGKSFTDICKDSYLKFLNGKPTADSSVVDSSLNNIDILQLQNITQQIQQISKVITQKSAEFIGQINNTNNQQPNA